MHTHTRNVLHTSKAGSIGNVMLTGWERVATPIYTVLPIHHLGAGATAPWPTARCLPVRVVPRVPHAYSITLGRLYPPTLLTLCCIEGAAWIKFWPKIFGREASFNPGTEQCPSRAEKALANSWYRWLRSVATFDDGHEIAEQIRLVVVGDGPNCQACTYVRTVNRLQIKYEAEMGPPLPRIPDSRVRCPPRGTGHRGHVPNRLTE